MATTQEIREALSLLTLGEEAQKTRPRMGTNRRPRSEADVSKRLVRKASLEVAVQARKEIPTAWLEANGIQGLGLATHFSNGLPVRDSRNRAQNALKVYVEQKLPKSKLDKKHRIPDLLNVDGMEIPIDVEAIGTLRLELNKERHSLPVQPGCSIFYKGLGGSGTLGCLVQKTGKVGGDHPFYILSNSHVIADQSNGEFNHPIVQPAEDDAVAGVKPHEIARLFEWVTFEAEHSERLNTCDAAIAKVIGSRVSPVIFGTEAGPVDWTSRVSRGMLVRKSGRTTPLGNVGRVKDIDFMTSKLEYKTKNGQLRPIRFHHQVLCERFTASGDSGAVVLDSRERVIGLHFAGSESVSVFNRIGFVLEAFDIEIVTN